MPAEEAAKYSIQSVQAAVSLTMKDNTFTKAEKVLHMGWPANRFAKMYTQRIM